MREDNKGMRKKIQKKRKENNKTVRRKNEENWGKNKERKGPTG